MICLFDNILQNYVSSVSYDIHQQMEEINAPFVLAMFAAMVKLS